MSAEKADGGFAAGIVAKFIDSDLAAVLLILSLALGAVALLTTPREEEPQIVVPLADIHVEAPELTRAEVERLVATPLERLCYQIDGVEHVYSFSRRGGATIVVRFHVGENREDSFTKLNGRVAAHYDQVPPGVSGWIIKPVEIDDVAVVAVTLCSARHDSSALRRVGEEVLGRLESIAEISRTEILGGAPREVVVVPDAAAMAARGVTLEGLQRAVGETSTELGVGAFERDGARRAVVVGSRPESVAALGRTIVGVRDDAPIFLSEVARIEDGPGEVEDLVRFRGGSALDRHPLTVVVEPPDGGPEREWAAVTLSLSKKKGTNAVTVAEEVIAGLRELVTAGVIPSGTGVVVTRDLGYTSDHKVSELVEALWVAIATVVGLITLVLGFREGFIVALAVPVTFAITLFVNELFGFTINRVTLFALILSLGLVVDDPIVDVENIARHLGFKGKKRRDAVLDAVNEVRPPIILATLAVIVSFLPMFFITGMMGPYMRPMALNVPLAMISSMIVAFTITPWLCNRMLKPVEEEVRRENALLRGYRRLMSTLLGRGWAGTATLLVVLLLFAGSLVLPLIGVVPLKMLPFDNKDEFQLLIDMPEGTSLAATDRVVRKFEDRLLQVPEVTVLQSYVGTASPLDFNGIVRHTYFRRDPHLADIRVNLAAKDERQSGTHNLVLRIRKELEGLATSSGAKLKILETPPGPPVISTITVEVKGDPFTPLETIEIAAARLAARLGREAGVVDVDVSTEEPHPRLCIEINERKAALSGVGEETVARLVAAAQSGALLGTLEADHDRNPVPIKVRMPRVHRSGIPELLALPVANAQGVPVRLGEIATITEEPVLPTINHKDLERVVYVFAEMAGRAPAEAILAVQADAGAAPPEGVIFEWAGEGEWQITLDVFRDLGLAFAAALVMIYILLLGQMRSYSIPLVVMSSIPLTMIGIFPGFALLNMFADREVGGYGDPVFFTATAMIGMIALAGIVVRNAIILVEFVHQEQAAGRSLREALVSAGAVRLRPVLMTAGTTLMGAWPITLDPIFSGLAWALIFGLLASTAFTMVVVPVAYWKIYGKKGSRAEAAS